jgi:hypothetical protein
MPRGVTLRRVIGTLVAAIATSTAVLSGPAGAGVEPEGDPQGTASGGTSSGTEVGAQAYHWDYCHGGPDPWFYIVLSTQIDGCGIDAQDVGWVYLERVSVDGIRMTICNNSTTAAFHGILDPNGPAAPIWYNDPPGGPCYVRTIGYVIRKFRAHWNTLNSGWAPPP